MFSSIDPRPPTYRTFTSEFLTILTVTFAQTMNQASTTNILPMMNSLSDSFPDVTEIDKSWFMASLPLTSGAFILISGKFGDLYGLKKVMISGILWSAVWCLVSALSSYSHNVVFFCIARSLQGIGLAFMLPNGIGIIGTTYPPGLRKALVFSAIGACAPFGATMGVIFGGLCTDLSHWTTGFYVQCGSLFGMAVLAWYGLPSDAERLAIMEQGKLTDEDKVEEKKKGMDWIGSILGVTGLVLFNFAWNQAPAVGWGEPYIIVLLIIGVLSLALFFVAEKYVAYPLIPSEIMNLNLLLILGTIAFGWASFGIWTYFYWAFMLNLKMWSPLDTGISYIPLLIFGVIAAFLVSALITRVRPSFILILAMLGFFSGIVMLALTPVHQTYYRMLLGQMILLSFGMDLSFPAASLILSDNLPPQHQGMASSLVSTFINYSMSISLGVAGTASSEVMKKWVKSHSGYTEFQYLEKQYRVSMSVGIVFAGIAVGLALLSFVWEKQVEAEDEFEAEASETPDKLEETVPDNGLSRTATNRSSIHRAEVGYYLIRSASKKSQA